MKRHILALIIAAIAIVGSGIAQVSTQEQLQSADAELNQVYQQLRGSLNADQKQQLRTAQRDWLKKRNAFVAANPSNPQGALYQATIQRVSELKGAMGITDASNQQVGSSTPAPKPVHVISTHNGENDSKIKNKPTKEDIIIALQQPHVFINETNAAALNVIYLKNKNLFVTHCGGRDIGTEELKFWERDTGKCLRTIDLKNSFKWIFPSEDEISLIAVAAESKISKGEWVSINMNTGKITQKYKDHQSEEHLPNESVKMSYFNVAPFIQDLGCRQGMCGDAFWDVKPLTENGSLQDKISAKITTDQKLNFFVSAPGRNIYIKCQLSAETLLSAANGNELSINDISAVYPFNAAMFIVILKGGDKAIVCDTRLSENKYNLLERNQVAAIQKSQKIPLKYYATAVYSISNHSLEYGGSFFYEGGQGSLLSSDMNTQIKLENEQGEIFAGIIGDDKPPLKVGIVGEKSFPPVQTAINSGAEKLVVSFKNFLSGIDLYSLKNEFCISAKEGKIFDNPVISPSSKNIYWTEISSEWTYPNGFKDPYGFEKSSSRSFGEHQVGSVFAARWDQSIKAQNILASSILQGTSFDLSKAAYMSSNALSVIDLENQQLQSVSNPYPNQPQLLDYAGLSGDLLKIINISIADPSKSGFFSISSGDEFPQIESSLAGVVNDDNVDGTSHISDLDISKNGEILSLIESKYRDAIICSTNENASPEVFPADGVTSVKWINEDKFYLTSQEGVAIVSIDGKVLSSWNLPNSSSDIGLKKWSGPDSWSYDPVSRKFFFAAYDGAVHALNFNKDDSFEERYKIYFSNDRIPIFVTPENFYATHSAKVSSIAFTEGVHSFPLEQFDLRLNRPDIVLDRLGAPKEAIEAAKSLRDKRLKRMGVTEEMLTPDFHLPELKIVGNVPATIAKDQIDLQIKATDDKYPLDRLRVYVNNVPVNGRDGELLRDQKTQSLEKTILIKLAAGRNKIQVSVLNSVGAESLYANAEVNCTIARTKPKLYAVALGVSQYDRPEWCLKYAAKDATDLISKIKEKAGSSYSEVKPLLLTDKDVTKESAAKIKEFLSGSTIDDTVLIFMAGHGILDDKYDYYFGTTDIDPAKPSERGMPYEAIDNILAEVPSLKKALLMDTCHAGELDEDEKKELAAQDGAAVQVPTDPSMSGKVAMRSIGTRGMSVKAIEGTKGKSDWYEKLQDMFVDLRRGSGATVISSSQGAEYAFESSEQSNGLFTYALMEALDGKADPNKDGQITISTVGDYVKKRVQDLTKGKQNPNLRGVNLEEDFILSSTK